MKNICNTIRGTIDGIQSAMREDIQNWYGKMSWMGYHFIEEEMRWKDGMDTDFHRIIECFQPDWKEGTGNRLLKWF